jgi:uncharacterized membrane protein YphA (DoxX/SURF4 family)
MTIDNTESSPAAPKKSPLRYVTIVVRSLMGLLFVVTGLNGFLNFIPAPTTRMPDGVVALIGAFKTSGYMLPLIMGTQLLAGLLLLINRFVPLALALIAPVIVNIVAFHIFLAPSGIGMASFVLLMELYLAWAYRKSFFPMLTARTTHTSR